MGKEEKLLKENITSLYTRHLSLSAVLPYLFQTIEKAYIGAVKNAWRQQLVSKFIRWLIFSQNS